MKTRSSVIKMICDLCAPLLKTACSEALRKDSIGSYFRATVRRTFFPKLCGATNVLKYWPRGKVTLGLWLKVLVSTTMTTTAALLTQLSSLHAEATTISYLNSFVFTSSNQFEGTRMGGAVRVGKKGRFVLGGE